jgi:outer membrane protein OmpA-like peptidoglycan-associated protein/tetratricopeptide (TPR) repeat protein
MLNLLLNITLLLFSFTAVQAKPNPNKLTKAKKHIRRSDYVAAAKIFENYLTLKPDDQYAQAEYASILYFDLKDYEKANPFIKKALTNSTDTLSFGLALLKTEIYLGHNEVALDLVDKLKKYSNSNPKYIEFKTELLYDIKILDYQKNHPFNDKMNALQVINAGSEVNSIYADYVSMTDLNEKFILLTSRRKVEAKEKVVDLENAYKEKMFSSIRNFNRFDTAFNVHYEFNGIKSKKAFTNESFVSLSPDGNSLYLFKQGTIWKSNQQNQKWEKPEKFEKEILDADYTNHGSISADGKHFYFSSEKEGGKGGLDIYHISKNADGTWSTIEPLSDLNTTGNEQGPYISNDGKTLYFSSDSLNGFGGYDIFKSEFDGKNWSNPVNLGMPFNSVADDIFFIPKDNGEVGYLSSNRKGTKGNFDVYRFYSFNKSDFDNKNLLTIIDEKDTTFTVNTNSLSKYVSKFLGFNPENSFFKLNDSVIFNNINDLNTTINKVTTKKIEIEQQLTCDDCPFKKVNFYTIYHKEESKKDSSNSIASTTSNNNTTNSSSGTNNTNNFNKENKQTVNFKFNQTKPNAETLNSIIESIKANKDAKFDIILEGHTDNVGSELYNQKLSEQRALAVKNELIKQKELKNRVINIKGFGESKPKIDCKNDCNADQHSQNRRVEIIFEPTK